MSAPAIRKRQITLLRNLASQTKGRYDAKLPLSQIASTLDIKSFAVGGTESRLPTSVYRFVDKESPQFEGGSDLAYDFNALFEEGFIEPTHMTFGQDASGGLTRSNPAIKITSIGFDVVAEANKRWMQKASNREIVIFGITVITAIAAGISYISWNDIVQWIKSHSGH
jgi:hypothetical protein